MEKKKPDIKDKQKRKSIPEDLKKQIEEYQRQKDEYLAGWQRARADLLNYKKEELKRVGELIKYVAEPLILKILAILDNFEIAEKNLSENLRNNEDIKGILQIKAQLKDFLKKQGVKKIECLGQKFDPNFQEIIEEVKTKGKESGIVIEEVQKGYLLHNKVIRPAKVKIAK